MLNFALCDDNKDFLELASAYIGQYLLKTGLQVQIHTFVSSETFLEVFHQTPFLFDLILLDIDMPIKDGLEIAYDIRKVNEEVLLVFLTGIEAKVFESFKVGAFRYLRKNFFKEEMEECILQALRKIKVSREYYMFKTEEGLMRIAMKEMMYFLCVNRKIELHTINSYYRINLRRMKDIEEQFENSYFIKIHRGCLVNLKYIKTIEEQNIILDNGERLMVSRYRMREVLVAYQGYIRQGE